MCVEESRALQFAHYLQLPVPKVHDVRASSSGTEIAVDFVEGECLGGGLAVCGFGAEN